MGTQWLPNIEYQLILRILGDLIVPGTKIEGIFTASNNPYFGSWSLNLDPPADPVLNMIKVPNGPAATSFAINAV